MYLGFFFSPESVSISQPPECVHQQTLGGGTHPASRHSVLEDEADPEVNVGRVPVHLPQRPQGLGVSDQIQRGPGDLRGRRGQPAPLQPGGVAGEAVISASLYVWGRRGQERPASQ